MQQIICEATTCTTLRRMGYNSRRPHRVALISTTNRKNWTIEDWKKVACSEYTWGILLDLQYCI